MSGGPKVTGTLQELIDSVPSLVDYFYNETASPHARDKGSLNPVPMEVTNWRDEQLAWRNSAILFDQSHHMPELFLEGKDALRLLSEIGINSFANFRPGMAKQFVACSPSGYVIGDCILYYLDDGSFELVSGMTLQDWVEFNAISRHYDVRIRRDLATPNNPRERVKFRFQLDGPAAQTIFAEVVQGSVPQIPFFRTATVTIAGCKVVALRHGMAGHRGVELSGRFSDYATVRTAILNAGEKHGIRAGGRLAYFSSAAESGWIPYPVPAIYTDPELKPFRQWLSGTSWEASTYIAGSFLAPRIQDYYTTVWDLGYDRILKFDHEFIGKAALEAMSLSKQRRKISLGWDPADVTRVYGSLFSAEVPYKIPSLPVTTYGFPHVDELRSSDGRLVGLAHYCSYSANEKRIISLGSVDEEFATPGTELRLVWGEPSASRKRNAEPHVQASIKVIVAPATYAETARTMKNATLGAAPQAAE